MNSLSDAKQNKVSVRNCCAGLSRLHCDSPVQCTNMSTLQILNHIHGSLTTYLTRREMRRLAACGTGPAKILQHERRVDRLLRRGRVDHATHLVPERFLSVREQMFLAPVNKSFYKHCLNRYGTQALVPWEIQRLQEVYERHLRVRFARQRGHCRACCLPFVALTARPSEVERFLTTGVCVECARVLLQEDLHIEAKMDRCRMLTEDGCALVEDWLHISQARESMRYEDERRFQRAILLARDKAPLGNPWRRHQIR